MTDSQKPAKKSSFFGSIMDKAKSFNFRSPIKHSSETTPSPPDIQQNQKFSRKSAVFSGGTFAPITFEHPSVMRLKQDTNGITLTAEKNLTSHRAMTNDIKKPEQQDGDPDDLISPETQPDTYIQSFPTSPIGLLSNQSQEPPKLRLRFEVTSDIRSTLKSENSFKHNVVVKKASEEGVAVAEDGELSFGSKASPRHNALEVGDNDNMMSSAYFVKSGIASPNMSPNISLVKNYKKEITRESENRNSEADGDTGSGSGNRIGLMHGLSLNHQKSSFMKFLPNESLKMEDSPNARRDMTPRTPFGAYTPFRTKHQPSKYFHDFSTSVAAGQVDPEKSEKELIGSLKSSTKVTMETIKEVAPVKTVICQGLRTFMFVIVSFGILTIVATLVTVPYERNDVKLWVDHFFGGFFLAGLSVTFLKGAMKIARREAYEADRIRYDLIKGDKILQVKYNDFDVHLLSGVLMVATGLAMVGMGNYIPKVINDRLYFVLINTGLLLVLGLIFWVYFHTKNKLEEKRVNGNKTPGFFNVRIYKNFMNDLYSTRGMLSKKENSSVSSSNILSPKPSLAKIDEGIDKYKPKQSFEIVTTPKILGSQVLIMVAYIEFIAIIGLIKLYQFIQEQTDGYLVTIPLLLAYPLIMYIFAKLAYITNQKTTANMRVNAYYMNAAFAAIFYQIVRYYFTDLNSLWVMIGCKGLYKVAVYLVFGWKIDFWKLQVASRLKGKFKKRKPLSLEVIEPSKKKASREKVIKMFAIRFVVICAVDILYGLVSLALQAVNESTGYKVFFSFLSSEALDNYRMSTGIEIGLDAALLMFIVLCWSRCRTYKGLYVEGIMKQYFKPFVVDYGAITLIQLISFLCLVHKV